MEGERGNPFKKATSASADTWEGSSPLSLSLDSVTGSFCPTDPVSLKYTRARDQPGQSESDGRLLGKKGEPRFSHCSLEEEEGPLPPQNTSYRPFFLVLLVSTRQSLAMRIS